MRSAFFGGLLGGIVKSGSGGGGTGSASRTLPTIAAASPAIWLDASNASTLLSDAGSTVQSTNGGAVQTFVDALGSGRSVAQAMAANRPTVALAKLNGRQMLANGSSQFMRSAVSQAWMNAMSIGQPFSCRLSFITTSNNTGQGIVTALTDGATNFSPGVDLYVSDGSGGFYVKTDGSGSINTVSTLNNIGVINHYFLRSSGSNIYVRRVAGGADVSSNLTPITGNTNTQLTLGFLPGVNWYLSGWFGEFALWPGFATSAEADADLNERTTWWGA